MNLSEHESFTKQVVLNLTVMGVESKRRKFVDSKISEHEVAPKKIFKQFDINSLLNDIEAYELKVITSKEDEVELSTVQTLMKLYQSAVEFYSAHEGGDGQILAKKIIDRMQAVMNRENVQILLLQ